MTERETMIQEISNSGITRKIQRRILIGMSLIPNLSTQLRFKAMLVKMDAEDLASGRISGGMFKVKTALRFIPLGGLAMAAVDTGTDLLSDSVAFLAEDLDVMTDEELKLLYSQIKKSV